MALRTSLVLALSSAGALGFAGTAAARPADGGSLSGLVVDGNGAPLPGICVQTTPGPSAQTGNDGRYLVDGVSPGNYRVQFVDCNVPATYASQWYSPLAHDPNGDSVGVVANTDTPLQDVTMLPAPPVVPASSVAGTVTGPAGRPLQGICVNANVVTNGGFQNVGQGTTTAVDGTYRVDAIPATTDVRIQFRDCNSPATYSEQWFQHADGPDDATPVVLAVGEARTGVDAQLEAGIAVAGTVTDAQGNPIEGVDVNVNPNGDGVSGWARTDATGAYRTGPVRAGSYRVQFSTQQLTPQWATQYWAGQPSQSTATPLMVASADGPVHGGVDAHLTPGATITGTVTGPGGAAAAGVCVTAVIDTPNGLDGIGQTDTGSDGTYSLTALPAAAVRVLIHDCHGVGPYAKQWWPGQTTTVAATVITLHAGDVRGGVDAQLIAAGRISGTVTDASHAPLEGICVQATTEQFFGALATTDSAGQYAILLDRPGAYTLQFVDCTDHPSHAGQHRADPIAVVAGETVSGIDATLAGGQTGSIAGRVTTGSGAGLTTACVVAYLPDGFARFSPVATDGSYLVADLPSGTYALGFLGCGVGDGDPQPTIADPVDSGRIYAAQWWNAVPLSLSSGDGSGPDPIAQHAQLVTVAAGQQLTGFDQCFGCAPTVETTPTTSTTTTTPTSTTPVAVTTISIVITGLTPGDGSITVAFTTDAPTALESFARAGSRTEATPVTYEATCSAPTADARSSAATSSPILVSGLTNGIAYTCTVTARVGTDIVASAVLLDVTATPMVASAAPVAAAPTRVLPATGAAIVRLASSAVAVTGFGLLLLGVRRRSRSLRTPER